MPDYAITPVEIQKYTVAIEVTAAWVPSAR